MSPSANGVAGEWCAPEGACDVSSIRDLYLSHGGDSIMTVRLKFNLFANDDGTNLTATLAQANLQFQELAENFEPYGIHFVASFEVVHSTVYRDYQSSDETAMKAAFADDPLRQCNIYVVDSGYGEGTFPWDPTAYTFEGGLIIDRLQFGPGRHILAHEVGHTLGLWHTHHGITEVPDCSACYEYADGTNGDIAGDYCGDTPPTPVTSTCRQPDGADCAGTDWGMTSPENYMSYSPDDCYSEFSAEQVARMKCWTSNVLYGWLVDCNGNGLDDVADVTSGRSLDCNFNLNPDECELDCNGNAVADVCEFTMGETDCDGNGNIDSCDADFDEDGQVDGCDPDRDNDGVPNEQDVCDFTPVGASVTPTGAPTGDTDNDCDIDMTDYRRFRLCFGGPDSTASNNCQNLFDSDADNNIDLADFRGLQIGYNGSN